MGESPVIDAAVATELPGLDVIPADADLSGVEIELGQPRGGPTACATPWSRCAPTAPTPMC
jgi:cellulose biosynthesis protein BcsQ